MVITPRARAVFLKFRTAGGISTAVAVVSIIVILALAAAAYFFVRQPPPVETCSSTLTSEAVQAGFVVGTTGSVGNTLDPASVIEPDALSLVRSIGDQLVDYEPGTSTPTPGLALSWSSSDGGSIWTFNLRQNLTLPDGTPFNATTEANSVSRTLSFDVGSLAEHGLDYLINATVVTGPYQIEFILNHASAVDFATDPSLDPVTQTAWSSGDLINYTGDVATENPTGLGPYLLESWTKVAGVDESVVLTANPQYWNAAAGYPLSRTLTILYYQDLRTLLSALSCGQVDLAYVDPSEGGISLGQAQEFASNPDYKVWTCPTIAGGRLAVLSTAKVSGVTCDLSGSDIFNYYLLAKNG